MSPPRVLAKKSTSQVLEELAEKIRELGEDPQEAKCGIRAVTAPCYRVVWSAQHIEENLYVNGVHIIVPTPQGDIIAPASEYHLVEVETEPSGVRITAREAEETLKSYVKAVHGIPKKHIKVRRREKAEVVLYWLVSFKIHEGRGWYKTPDTQRGQPELSWPPVDTQKAALKALITRTIARSWDAILAEPRLEKIAEDKHVVLYASGDKLVTVRKLTGKVTVKEIPARQQLHQRALSIIAQMGVKPESMQTHLDPNTLWATTTAKAAHLIIVVRQHPLYPPEVAVEIDKEKIRRMLRRHLKTDVMLIGAWADVEEAKAIVYYSGDITLVRISHRNPAPALLKVKGLAQIPPQDVKAILNHLWKLHDVKPGRIQTAEIKIHPTCYTIQVQNKAVRVPRRLPAAKALKQES